MGLLLQMAWYFAQFMFIGGSIPLGSGTDAATLSIPEGGVWGALIDWVLTPNYTIALVGLVMWILIALMGKGERILKI